MGGKNCFKTQLIINDAYLDHTVSNMPLLMTDKHLAF